MLNALNIFIPTTPLLVFCISLRFWALHKCGILCYLCIYIGICYLVPVFFRYSFMHPDTTLFQNEVIDAYAKRGWKCFCEVARSGSYSSTAYITPCFEYLKIDEPQLGHTQCDNPYLEKKLTPLTPCYFTQQ